ncbi:MAG TPA: LUD domain-containing protein, partial [Chloroflexota bacterium]
MTEKVAVDREVSRLVAAFTAAATVVMAQVIRTDVSGLAPLLAELVDASQPQSIGYSEEIRQLLGVDAAPLVGGMPDLWINRGLLGIAETGSVAVAERDASQRAPALLCRTNIVVLPSPRIVPSLVDAAPWIRSWAQVGRSHVTFVSGP